MSGASWRVERNEPNRPLVIADDGDHRHQLTVTNDAERVVRILVQAGLLPDDRRLWYYDSERDLDEILVRDGRFAGFAPIDKDECRWLKE